MKSITVTRTFPAPIDDVFGLVSDIPRASQSIKAITKTEMLTDGPVGVGTKWKETRKVMGREATETMWITEFEPNDRYVVEAESCGVHYRSVLAFKPTAAGGTDVSMTFGGTPLSLFAKLMTPLGFLFAGMMRKCLEDDMNDLEKAVAARNGAQ